MQYDGIKTHHHFVDGYPEKLWNRKEAAFTYCTLTAFLSNIKNCWKSVVRMEGFKGKGLQKGAKELSAVW